MGVKRHFIVHVQNALKNEILDLSKEKNMKRISDIICHNNNTYVECYSHFESNDDETKVYKKEIEINCLVYQKCNRTIPIIISYNPEIMNNTKVTKVSIIAYINHK